MGVVYFISGIDTGCGKTYVTGRLANFLKKNGKKVVTHKVVQTGCSGKFSEDIVEHRRLMHIDLLDEDYSGLTCPYVFSFPASPHYSSRLEEKTISLNRVEDSLLKLSNDYDVVLCEGAGGLMVPLTEEVRMLDFIEQNRLPLILVVSSRLGGLNHAMLTLEVCLSYEIDLKCIIFNQFPNDDEGMSKDMFHYLSQYLYKKMGKKGLLSLDLEFVASTL